MVPDLRIGEHGRIRELVHDQVVLVTVAVILALAPLSVRGQDVERVGGGHRHGCSLPVCGRIEIGCGLLTATTLDEYAFVLGETGLDPQIDTGLAGTALGVTGRVLRTATDHVDSVRVPLLAGEVAVTVRGHAISRVDLVTVRGHAIDDLLLLTARGLGRKDGKPDEINRRVVVSQAPAVSEAPTGVTPVAGGASLSTLPSAVQDLARFFLSLSGSSSLGAVGGVAGVAASTAGSGVQLCPSTSAGGAVALSAATAIPAGAG